MRQSHEEHRSLLGDANRVVQTAEVYVRENPIGEVIVRLEKDRAPETAGWLDAEKWADATYYLFGPLLPPRDHTLKVKVRTPSWSRDCVRRRWCTGK